MRTTIDLPDELHRIVASLAVHQRASLSRTAADLIRRGLESPVRSVAVPEVTVHAVTGLPVAVFPRIVTPQDVAALDDVGT